jgi:hypothetical protein
LSSPSLFDEAVGAVEAFRVLPSERGWHVWHFWRWDHPNGGWWIVVPYVKTEVDGWMHVLSRLGLTKDKPPAPLPPRAKPAVVEEEWP